VKHFPAQHTTSAELERCRPVRQRRLRLGAQPVPQGIHGVVLGLDWSSDQVETIIRTSWRSVKLADAKSLPEPHAGAVVDLE
jgi:hypothetical protein